MTKPATSREVVRLYRRVLQLAKQYPSIKRDALVEDIKLEFHEAKHLTDATAIEHKIAAAQAGIKELSQYASLRSDAMSWTVDVGREVEPQQPASEKEQPTFKVVGDDTRNKQ
jgi:LYR motif-containing protein 4